MCPKIWGIYPPSLKHGCRRPGSHPLSRPFCEREWVFWAPFRPRSAQPVGGLQAGPRRPDLSHLWVRQAKQLAPILLGPEAPKGPNLWRRLGLFLLYHISRVVQIGHFHRTAQERPQNASTTRGRGVDFGLGLGPPHGRRSGALKGLAALIQGPNWVH